MTVASDRPRIGIVGDRRAASFGAWSDVELSFVWSHYVEALEDAGAAPVVFPASEVYAEVPGLALELIDGLLLTGGRDIDAASYGAEPDPRNEPGDPGRDGVERAIAEAALARDVPILGVCRGMQLLNLIAGGGIEQHLEDPGAIHRGSPGTFTAHEVEVEPDTRLASILGSVTVEVRSHHHQGVGPLGHGWVVSGRSPDGVIEAIEAPGRDFCLAVLWHPEEDLPGGGLSLYDALVAAAGARRPAVTP